MNIISSMSTTPLVGDMMANARCHDNYEVVTNNAFSGA